MKYNMPALKMSNCYAMNEDNEYLKYTINKHGINSMNDIINDRRVMINHMERFQ